MIQKLQRGLSINPNYKENNLYKASYDLPEVKISSNRPSWQHNLNDYDLMRLKTNQINIETAKSIAQKRATGTSNFMRDINKLAWIPNSAAAVAGGLSMIAAPSTVNILTNVLGAESVIESLIDKDYKNAFKETVLNFTPFHKTASLLPIVGKTFKNTLKGFNSSTLPSELKNPLFLSHTMTGSRLAEALTKNNGKLAAPSIAIVSSTENKIPSVMFPIHPNDGKYTFYFKPNYIDNLEHRAISRDMFSPTYSNAETWAGKQLNPEEVINTKREMLNNYNTISDLQDLVDFNTHKTIEGAYVYTDTGIPMYLNDILRNERRIPPTLQNAGHSLRNRINHTKSIYGMGEVMPLDYVDLNQSPLIIGSGSNNPIVLNFLKNKNFYEIGKPVTNNVYDIPGLAFKKGGKLCLIQKYKD